MIDAQSFGVGMGVLAERFRSPLAPAAQSGYYAILSRELTTEEFEVAVQLAFRLSRFWPSPQELIDFANPPRNLELEAQEAFDKMRDLGEAIPGHGQVWRRELVEGLGEPAVAGWKAIGANEGMRNLEAKNLHWFRQNFVNAYKAKASQTRAEKQIEAARQSLPRQRRAIKSAPVSIGEVVLVEAGKVS